MALSSIYMKFASNEPFCPLEYLEDDRHFFIQLGEWCKEKNVEWKYHPKTRSHVFRKTEYETEVALELCFGDAEFPPVYEVSYFQMSAAESMQDRGLEGLCRSIEISLNRIKVTYPGDSTNQGWPEYGRLVF